MSNTYNVYCDESCHLENDRQKAMVLGAVWCPDEKRIEIYKRLREIKARHGFDLDFESKWTKVSPSKLEFYLDFLDYFFDDDDLHFRGVIIPDKSVLDHQMHGQDHDTWYYKMYFTLLKVIIDPASRYRIYLDIKDTHGQEKVEKLKDVLKAKNYDYSNRIIQNVQRVRSHEIEILQLTDLIIGGLSYLHRDLSDSSAKLRLIERLRDRSGYSLLRNTLYREQKFNLLVWNGGEQ